MFDLFHPLLDNNLARYMKMDLYRELCPMERQSMELPEKM
jgi:hypothetical protein